MSAVCQFNITWLFTKEINNMTQVIDLNIILLIENGYISSTTKIVPSITQLGQRA